GWALLRPARQAEPGRPLSVEAGMTFGKHLDPSALAVGQRRTYSVTGDALNLAARARQCHPWPAAPHGGSQVGAAGLVFTRADGTVPREGKSYPVVIYCGEREAPARRQVGAAGPAPGRQTSNSTRSRRPQQR
ncbi:MAG: hypothetical protein ACRDZX_06525, partial [Acidimicrobiales bacterium]